MRFASDDTEATESAPFCHPDRGMDWFCLGCERRQCDWCDGTDNGSGLCWSCYSAAPDHETNGSAA